MVSEDTWTYRDEGDIPSISMDHYVIRLRITRSLFLLLLIYGGIQRSHLISHLLTNLTKLFGCVHEVLVERKRFDGGCIITLVDGRVTRPHTTCVQVITCTGRFARSRLLRRLRTLQRTGSRLLGGLRMLQCLSRLRRLRLGGRLCCLGLCSGFGCLRLRLRKRFHCLRLGLCSRLGCLRLRLRKRLCRRL